MDVQVMRENFTQVRAKRQLLVDLLARPDLSESLLTDVRQALEELDELGMEFDKTFVDR
ncbi:hypothetical protein [Candidatus Cyanaurora vandensis]|uniref:hypothetical protein n=1 Tax=Candidatus Cyanaurora vandensis TaxID=2714958 RepID=UPI0025809E07|nr:hypothetical protein [Candidatus Cyanaurora vandensis]